MKHHEDLLVIYVLTKPELGGAQKVCLALVDGIHDADIKTHLITGTHGPLAASLSNKHNITSLPSLVREVSLLNDIRCLKTLISILRNYKKQHANVVVHTHSTKAGVLGRLAAWFAGTRVVHTIHGYGFHAYQKKHAWWATYIVERILGYLTTHFICVSQEDAKTGMRLFPAFKDKHSIIRAAVNHAAFKRPLQKAPAFPTAPVPFIFGTISCFKPQKNLLDLIKAFKVVQTAQPHARLEIIGDGIMRQEIEQTIRDLNLTGFVTLHGWQHTVQPYMERWHTFVLSSLWEGLPCALLEARLMHIPVVCYDTGGIREIIHHQHNGLLTNRSNWQTLAEHMNAVISSEQLYRKFQSYNDNLDDFTIPTMLHQHQTLYRSLMKGTMHPVIDES